jgi:hypothetical protein
VRASWADGIVLFFWIGGCVVLTYFLMSGLWSNGFGNNDGFALRTWARTTGPVAALIIPHNRSKASDRRIVIWLFLSVLALAPVYFIMSYFYMSKFTSYDADSNGILGDFDI